jgi:hypothetical protein
MRVGVVLKESSRRCELERLFVAGKLRHREDWNRYVKRTLGKNFHEKIGDEERRSG